LESFGGEGRGGNIFNLICLVQFLEGEDEGSKIPQDPLFAFSNWSFFLGRDGISL